MDIKCVKCGEPWDSYGVNHGDMLPWEAKLFKAGAGCPSCEGSPAEPWTPETITDIENGDEDPIERLHAWEDASEGKAPKWERPCDEEHWVCDSCDVRVVTNQDTGELEYDCRFKTAAWYNAYEYENHGDPEKEPAHTFEGGFAVCEFCLTSCDKCGAKLSHKVTGDCYDDGYVWTVGCDREHAYCSDCHGEAEEEEAQEVWRTCYSPDERIAYMRKNWSQFEHCHARWYPDTWWRSLLECVRGNAFYGYASELIS